MAQIPTAGPVVTLAILAALAAGSGHAQEDDATPYCGNEGVWIQILGGGGPELDDGMASASYVLFVDNVSRLLVDTAPGSSAAFDQAGGTIDDLEAILLTQLHPHHASDLPAFLEGTYYQERDDLLPVIGPDGDGPYPGTESFVERLIGEEGAYPYLSQFLTFEPQAGYRVSPRSVPAAGRKRRGGFGSPDVALSAIPVHHGPVPALAWRADAGGMSVVFTGDFSNRKNVMPEFARGADALVIHHAVPESARGELADLYVKPGEIGRIAAQAEVRMVILGHRMTRTRGLESLTRQAITEHYDGSVIFADEMECWGL